MSLRNACFLNMVHYQLQGESHLNNIRAALWELNFVGVLRPFGAFAVGFLRSIQSAERSQMLV